MKFDLGIASDHAGFELKKVLIEYLESVGCTVTDYGCFSEDSCDYPDYAHPLANAVEAQKHNLGISICGSGNGISMTLNKHKKIRAALCWNKEIAELARAHNDANICSLPGRFVSVELAKEIVEAFLNTGFDGGRHQRRIDKIPVM